MSKAVSTSDDRVIGLGVAFSADGNLYMYLRNEQYIFLEQTADTFYDDQLRKFTIVYYGSRNSTGVTFYVNGQHAIKKPFWEQQPMLTIIGNTTNNSALVIGNYWYRQAPLWGCVGSCKSI